MIRGGNDVFGHNIDCVPPTTTTKKRGKKDFEPKHVHCLRSHAVSESSVLNLFRWLHILSYVVTLVTSGFIQQTGRVDYMERLFFGNSNVLQCAIHRSCCVGEKERGIKRKNEVYLGKGQRNERRACRIRQVKLLIRSLLLM